MKVLFIYLFIYLLNFRLLGLSPSKIIGAITGSNNISTPNNNNNINPAILKAINKKYNTNNNGLSTITEVSEPSSNDSIVNNNK